MALKTLWVASASPRAETPVCPAELDEVPHPVLHALRDPGAIDLGVPELDPGDGPVQEHLYHVREEDRGGHGPSHPTHWFASATR